MSRYKTKNQKIVGRKFTMISPVLGEVAMQQLDLGGGKHINANLSDTISPCTATITIAAADDPADPGAPSATRPAGSESRLPAKTACLPRSG